jgi:hypothetical protein
VPLGMLRDPELDREPLLEAKRCLPTK